MKYGLVFCVIFETIFDVYYIFHGQDNPSMKLPSENSDHAKDSKKIICILRQHLPFYGELASGNKAHYSCPDQKHFCMPNYHRWGGPCGTRMGLSGVSLNESGVLDFHVQLQTSLKLLLVGNSLAGQLSASLQEAFCHNHSNSTYNIFIKEPCKVIDFLGQNKALERDSLARVVHLTGGGILAQWGSMEMIHVGQGEWRSNSTTMLDLWNATRSSELKMDVLIFHLPSGHVRPNQVSFTTLNNIVSLSAELFQCTSVIFINFSLTSNINSDNLIDEWESANECVHSFCKKYNSTHSQSSVNQVEFLDFAKLSKKLITANGDNLGIPVNEIFSSRLDNRKWRNLIAHVCGEIPFPNNRKGCSPNMLTVDGTHWCPETIHGRLDAGLACILGCIYNKKQTIPSLSCSEQCNERFMSLEPLLFEDGIIEL